MVHKTCVWHLVVKDGVLYCSVLYKIEVYIAVC